MTLTVGSVCTGIGGFDLGFSDEFEVAWMCEKDPACQKVLRRHFDVPVYDDLTLLHGASTCDGYDSRLFTTAEGCPNCVPDVDVLIGGTPCQSFSVAGRREGMDGESGLFLHFARLVSEITPEWVLWENVPGVLSLDHGEVFADIIELLSGTRPVVPVDGWRRAGFGSGTDRGVAWRVLDAQHFGVPQRRRRIFVVSHLGTPWSAPAEVLFEPDSRPGDLETGGEEGEDAAPDVEDSPRAERAQGFGADPNVAGTLGGGSGTRGWCDDLDRAGALVVEEPSVTPLVVGDGWDDKVARTLTSPGHGPHFDLDTENFVVDEHSPAIPFRKARRAQSDEDVETWVEEDVANTLNQFDSGDVRATMAIVEVIPIDSAATGGRSGDAVTPSPDAEGRVRLRPPGLGVADPGAPSYTIPSQGSPPGVATALIVRRLTPTEAERLQGFDDGWTDGQSDSARYKQLWGTPSRCRAPSGSRTGWLAPTGGSMTILESLQGDQGRLYTSRAVFAANAANAIAEGSAHTLHEHVSRTLFGNTRRLDVGVWIAQLNDAEAEVFWSAQYGEWCRVHGHHWPGDVGAELRRFELLGMVEETGKDRAVYYRRLPSAMWDVFIMTDVVIAEVAGERKFYQPSAARRDQMIGELLEIRAQLLADSSDLNGR